MSNMSEGIGQWSRGKWAAAAVAIIAVVGVGGYAASQALIGSPAVSQATVTQAGIQAGTSASATAQALVLRDALTTTGIRRLVRLRLLGGMYGQFTYATKQGPRTLAFERGTITSVSGSGVVVRAADGTTWTWLLTGTSVVRENGTKQPVSTLAAGQLVFAGGPVTSGARDARLIVLRKAAKTSQTSDTA